MKKSMRKRQSSRKPARPAARRRANGVKRGRRAPLLTAAQIAKSSVQVKGNKLFSIAQAKERRDYLLRLRERMTGQINFLATDNLSRSEKDNEVSFRSEEQGTDNFDRDFALNRVSLDQDILFEIDEALNRLALGTYGTCDSCGKGIEKARLKAVPYSRMCIACQSKNEAGRKKFKSFESAAFFYSTDKAVAEAGADEE